MVLDNNWYNINFNIVFNIGGFFIFSREKLFNPFRTEKRSNENFQNLQFSKGKIKINNHTFSAIADSDTAYFRKRHVYSGNY